MMNLENNSIPLFIVKTCKGRENQLSELIKKIPNLITSYDDVGGHYCNFQKSLMLAGDNPCVHIEDDIILCENFYSKILNAIEEDPLTMIQFFSMRAKDLSIGTRLEPGRTFMMNQCVYYPKNYSKLIYDYSFEWYEKNCTNHPSGSDCMVADYLKKEKIKYKIYVPNLVDHIIGKSMIDPKRSSKRQSKTFKNNENI